VYIVSDKRMYRLSADRTGRPHIDREMSYRNSGIPKPSQVDAGSGIGEISVMWWAYQE